MTLPIELQSFFVLLLQAAIGITVPILAALAVRGVEAAVRLIRTKLSAEQQKVLDELVGVAVRAAEQSGLKDLIVNTGSEKKSYALGALQELLRQRGLGYLADNTTALEAMIEEAVLLGVQNPEKYLDAQPIAVPGQLPPAELEIS